MSLEEIKNRLKAGESVEFIVYETGKSFDEIYKIFEECKKEGYIKVHHSNRLRRRIPNGKLVYRQKTKTFPAVFINIDNISSITIKDDEIMVYLTNGLGYYIDDKTLEKITSKMGVV